MKQISGLKYFPHLFTNSTPPQHLPLTALSQCKCKIVFRLVPRRVVGRVYISIAQNLKLNLSIPLT